MLTGNLAAAIGPSTAAASKSTLGGALAGAAHLHAHLADGLLHGGWTVDARS